MVWYHSRTPLIRPPSESHWCGRIRGMVAREGFVYEQKPLSVTRNVVVWEGWSLVRVVVRQGFYCSPFAILVNLRMLLSTRFFGGFTIPWGPWRNSTWLSSGRPWAIVWICKLVPPLLKHLFSSISWQLCIISSQKLCLHECFHWHCEMCNINRKYYHIVSN